MSDEQKKLLQDEARERRRQKVKRRQKKVLWNYLVRCEDGFMLKYLFNENIVATFTVRNRKTRHSFYIRMDNVSFVGVCIIGNATDK